MTWYKIQDPLLVTTVNGDSQTIPGGLWRVVVTPAVVTIGTTNMQTSIDSEQWDSIVQSRRALPLPRWDNT